MNGKRAFAVVSLALGLFALPNVAFGQGETWIGKNLAETISSARWKLDILRVNAALELSNFGYDSDIYYGYKSADPGVVELAPDGTVSASLPVQVLLPVGRSIVVDLYNNPRYDFYLSEKTQRGWNNTFRGQTHFALNRLYFLAGGEIANNRRRLSQELDILVREIASSYDGLALWQASRATSIALLYRSKTFRYGDAPISGGVISETLNRKEDSFDLVAYVQPSPRSRYYIDSRLGTYAFAAPISRFKDTRSYSFYGGFSSVLRKEGPSRVGGVFGNARLGYMRLDILDTEQPDGSGLAGDIDLSVGILKLTTARVFFSRGFQFSVLYGATYFAQTAYGAGISRSLSKRTSFSYDFSFGRSSYPKTSAGGGALSGLSHRYTSHSVRLNTTLSRDLTVAIIGTIGQRVLKETGQAWNRNFFGLSLIYGVSSINISTPFGGLSR